MTREEMLTKLNVSAEELRDFADKMNALQSTLNERQKALFLRSWPDLHQVAAAFGSNVTEAELLKLLEEILGDVHVFCCFPDVRAKNRQ